MRLFLDANVLFTAAHNPNGKAILIIDLGTKGYWKLFSSLYAWEEARRNLERKFPQSLIRFEELHERICLVEQWAGLSFPKALAQKDQPIFQAALACHATHLLTGDLKDFGALMNQPDNTSGICIQTVADFLDQLA